MKYKAHINEITQEEQTVKAHSENTANMARDFAIPEMKKAVYAAGMLHDLGKYQQDFQRKINGEAIAVEHSACGAIEAKKYYSDAEGLLIQLCIVGHHTGLTDCGEPNDTAEKPTLYGRLERKFQNYDAYREELEIPKIDERSFAEFIARDCTSIEQVVDKYAFFVRYAFSCLTDADSIDTEEACTEQKRKMMKTDFATCLAKVDKRLSAFQNETKLQKTRDVIQKQAFDKSKQDAEIYLMNMPTGSGKTLCSIKVALERAIQKKKKRIIYIIPYNSIIDQTADTFSKLFGEDAQILRHQSTFSPEDMKEQKEGKLDEDYRNLVKKSTENWDAEFIITTAVQFFESIYGNKRNKLRKLHNMGDSVLVFDEIHMMPQNYLQPCIEAITYITRYLNSEAIFLTATMPDFSGLFRKYSLPGSKILDLVPDKSDFAVFQRCEFQNLGVQSKEGVLAKAMEFPTSLLIVNKKANAKELYALERGKKYHLSTYMTAFDRRQIISEICRELKELEEDYPGLQDVPEERRIMVFSTSLIEAGIDLDFSVVFRELSGVDHILQSGGRCNREGKRKCAVTYIFELDTECGRIGDSDIANQAELANGILEEYESLTEPEAIRAYYERLFQVKKERIVKNSMHQYCKDLTLLPFKKYTDDFEFIEKRTVSIIVERDEISRKLIETLKGAGRGNERKLQNYACTVRQKEFDILLKQGVIDDFNSGIYCLTNPDYYDKDTGIRFE